MSKKSIGSKTLKWVPTIALGAESVAVNAKTKNSTEKRR